MKNPHDHGDESNEASCAMDSATKHISKYLHFRSALKDTLTFYLSNPGLVCISIDLSVSMFRPMAKLCIYVLQTLN